jgi:hypothetical protein
MHACSATINLFNDMADEYRESFSKVAAVYENQFLQQLIRLLKISPLSIQQAAITALASIADHLGILFT